MGLLDFFFQRLICIKIGYLNSNLHNTGYMQYIYLLRQASHISLLAFGL